jgi:hypothetical protein
VGEDEGEGFARCTTTFLGAFFSFVTRAPSLSLSPAVVAVLVMVARMTKLGGLCV